MSHDFPTAIHGPAITNAYQRTYIINVTPGVESEHRESIFSMNPCLSEVEVLSDWHRRPQVNSKVIVEELKIEDWSRSVDQTMHDLLYTEMMNFDNGDAVAY
jgi:hypothetical protein